MSEDASPSSSAQGSATDDRGSPVTPAARPWHRRHLWQMQPVRDLLLVALAWLLLKLGHELQVVTVPMLVGLGLAYLVEPLIGALGARWRWATRRRVVVGLLGVIIALVLAIAAIVVPMVVSQIGQLASKTPRYARTLIELAEHDQVPDVLTDGARQLRPVLGMTVEAEGRSTGGSTEGDPGRSDPESGGTATPGPTTSTVGLDSDDERIRRIVREELTRQRRNEGGAAGLGGLSSAVTRALGAAWAVLVSVVSGTIGLAIGGFLLAFFFVVFGFHYPRVIEFGRSLIPADRRAHWVDLSAQMDRAVSGFVRGRLIIAVILASVFIVGWSIGGVPYALILGLVVGVFTLVPYLAGAGLALAYALLVVDLLGGGDGAWYRDAEGGIVWWAVAVVPAIPFVVAQLLDDYLLTPLIQGKATNLSPASIVVAVLAGGALAGLYGMLLAIPAAACIKILVVAEVWPRVQAWLRGERDDPLPLENGETD